VFPTITIGGAPRERGRQYGSQARAQIRHSIGSYAALFAYDRGLDWSEMQALALGYLPVFEEVVPDLVGEMRGVAEGAGCALAEILALNARTELLAGIGHGPAHPGFAEASARNRRLGVPERGECTTVAALPEAASDGATTYLAQTWDWNGGQRAACLVLRIQAPGEPEVLTVTEGGILAKIGLNSAGLAVALNILRSRADGREPGMAVHLLLRAALQCSRVEEVLALAERAPAAASSCVTVAEEAGRAVSLEITPAGVAQVLPEAGLLAHTNHCVDARAREGEAPHDPASSTLPRIARAQELLRAGHGRIDTAALIALLRDRAGAPLCICRDPDLAVTPIDRIESVLGVVMDLRRRVMHLAPDVPDRVEFTPITL
jgi:isopenicillin-N N-acyltransferase like protein